MKNLLIGIGALAVLGGVGFYFYNKSKSSTTGGGGDGDSGLGAGGEGLGGGTTTEEQVAPTTEVPTPEVPLSKKEKRKDDRVSSKVFKSTCGRQPLRPLAGALLTGGFSNIGYKKRKAVWDGCVAREKAAQGSAFDGFDNFDGFELDI